MVDAASVGSEGGEVMTTYFLVGLAFGYAVALVIVLKRK